MSPASRISSRRAVAALVLLLALPTVASCGSSSTPTTAAGRHDRK
ncbi:hypothetical protein [Protofrankia symbiont of Coriaria ruscifolia]|nr:hypothetical protein [Protofrankia symbiont of Coriaria ruscifolia]